MVVHLTQITKLTRFGKLLLSDLFFMVKVCGLEKGFNKVELINKISYIVIRI